MYEYRCEIVSVVDGDTMHLDVDLGCDAHILMTVRLTGINAPEKGQAREIWSIFGHDLPRR